MVIPDRDVLRRVVAELKDERLDEKNASLFAGKVLALSRSAPDDAVPLAIQYLMQSPIEAFQEFHGDGAPERGDVVLIRYHLGELKRLAEDGNLPLPSSQIADLVRTLSERDPFMAQSASLTSTDSVKIKRLSSDLQMGLGGRRSHPSHSGEFPTAPSTSSAWVPVPEAIVELDVLGQPVKRREFRYYVFSAVMLGFAVGLTLEALEVDWPFWVKAVVCVGVPSFVLGFVAFSKSLVLLRYLRSVLVWGSVAVAVVAGANYGYAMWTKLRAIERYERVSREFDGLAAAMRAYHAKEGIYPRTLELLFFPVDYTSASGYRVSSNLFDPFGKPGEQYGYQRTLDAYLVRSVGPLRTGDSLELPGRMTADFRQNLVTASYDPTNGIFSAGSIFLFGTIRSPD